MGLRGEGEGLGSHDEGGRVAQLRWRVKLVAERPSGVTTETELTCMERDEQTSLAGLGLRLEEGACNLVVGRRGWVRSYAGIWVTGDQAAV